MAGINEVFGDPASAGVWNVVPEQSTIAVKAKSMWGIAPVKGRFTEFSGDGQLTDTQTVFGRIDIKVASLQTGNRKRDVHLHSADFFDAERFPDISVVVTSAEGIRGDTVDLRAQLTIKGTTKPLPLKTEAAVLGDGDVRLTTQATVDRREFGVDGNLMGMIGDKVTISGDVVFRRAG